VSGVALDGDHDFVRWALRALGPAEAYQKNKKTQKYYF
jgi:hypothetical protein